MARKQVVVQTRRGAYFTLELSHASSGDPLAMGSVVLTVCNGRETNIISDDRDQIKYVLTTLLAALEY